jgi:hypothetical protein
VAVETRTFIVYTGFDPRNFRPVATSRTDVALTVAEGISWRVSTVNIVIAKWVVFRAELLMFSLPDSVGEDTAIFRNVGSCTLNDTASHPRRLESLKCLLYKVKVKFSPLQA